MSTLAKKRTSPQIQEAAKLMGIGIIQQQSGNYEMSKANMTAGIEKIKQSLISDSMIDREMILNYYSLFEKFLLNCSNQQEIEKNNSEIKLSLLELQDNISNPQETFKDIYDDYIKFKKMYITVILKVSYLVLAIYLTLVSFTAISTSFLVFLLILIFGNLILRLIYEFSLVLLSIQENVAEINKKTKK